MEQKIHQGKNIKRFREMLGIKQEALAWDLGDDWSQKKVSLIEQREVIEDRMLEKISGVLQVPAEVFRNFDGEQAVNIISSTFINRHNLIGSPSGILSGMVNNYNPLDKLIELHDQKISLYERMLKEKEDMMERIEKFINK